MAGPKSIQLGHVIRITAGVAGVVGVSMPHDRANVEAEEAERIAAAFLIAAARVRAGDSGEVKWTDAETFAAFMRGVAADAPKGR